MNLNMSNQRKGGPGADPRPGVKFGARIRAELRTIRAHLAEVTRAYRSTRRGYKLVLFWRAQLRAFLKGFREFVEKGSQQALSKVTQAFLLARRFVSIGCEAAEEPVEVLQTRKKTELPVIEPYTPPPALLAAVSSPDGLLSREEFGYLKRKGLLETRLVAADPGEQFALREVTTPAAYNALQQEDASTRKVAYGVVRKTRWGPRRGEATDRAVSSSSAYAPAGVTIITVEQLEKFRAEPAFAGWTFTPTEPSRGAQHYGIFRDDTGTVTGYPVYLGKNRFGGNQIWS